MNAKNVALRSTLRRERPALPVTTPTRKDNNVIDLRGYGAHVHGTPIVLISDGLAHDLHRCGYCGPEQWAPVVNDIMANAIDTGEDDGLPGWYYQSEINLVDDRGVTTTEVFAERFHDDGISVFYPDER